MKRFTNILLLGLLAYVDLLAPSSEIEIDFITKEWAMDETRPYEPLWTAICSVESDFRHDVVNIPEQAYGIAQIRQIRLDDYNVRTGESLCLNDCLDSAISRRVFMYYALELRDYEVIAKRWNGSGPMTIVYWEKVELELK